jgi:hypothetical protein
MGGEMHWPEFASPDDNLFPVFGLSFLDSLKTLKRIVRGEFQNQAPDDMITKFSSAPKQTATVSRVHGPFHRTILSRIQWGNIGQQQWRLRRSDRINYVQSPSTAAKVSLRPPQLRLNRINLLDSWHRRNHHMKWISSLLEIFQFSSDDLGQSYFFLFLQV